MRIELKIPPIKDMNDGNSAGAAACAALLALASKRRTMVMPRTTCVTFNVSKRKTKEKFGRSTSAAVVNSGLRCSGRNELSCPLKRQRTLVVGAVQRQRSVFV
uniref:RNase_PH domain-containing protein n=1 Tax=Globodera pallida TaxID=36090 RepID=A0A183CBG1_GLOPA